MIPHISVIIPTYNEEKLIGKCLTSIVNQKIKLHYEVIVVDSNSKDKTQDIVKQFPVRLIETDKLGKGNARQTGVDSSKGKILVFTEADCVVPNDWIERIIENYEKHHEIAGINGIYKLKTEIWWLDIFSRPCIIVTEYIFRIFFGHHSFRATNFSVLKNIFERSGGFSIKKRELDDVDLSRRVHKFGRILFDPKLCVTTSDRRFKNRTGKFLKEFIVNFINLIVLNRKKTSTIYEDIRT